MTTTRPTTKPLARQARAPKPPKPMSATQRDKLAKQGIVTALSASNEKAAVTAALEVVNEWLAWDTALRQRLGEKYEELQALIAVKPRRESGEAPKPISGSNSARFSGFAKLDPYPLLEEFGREGLREALADVTQRLLRQGVEVVQAREPSTMPRSKTRNQDMIDYIVEYVAGPGY